MSTGRVTRRIRFFSWESMDPDAGFAPSSAAAAVVALAEDDWRLERGEMTTAAIVDRTGSDSEPSCLRFFRLRADDDVPHKMDVSRATTPIEVGVGESITDWTHVVIWPDGFAAHDPRRDAPSLARLSAYFSYKADADVRFRPLYDRSLIQRLKQLDDLRAVEIRISNTTAMQELADADLGMFKGLFSVARDTESATFASTISVGRKKKQFLADELKNDVVALAESAIEFLDHLVIRGVKDGEREYLDLLTQRIEAWRSVNRAAPNVRVPTAEAMYQEIIAARGELDEEDGLQQATVGSLG